MNSTMVVSASQNTNQKLIIFDMDKTLFDETLYEDIPKILENLHKKRYRMAIASYNPFAKWLCDRYSITKYFDIICGYYSHKGKMTHMREIFNFYKKRGYNVNPENTIFYDDDPNNINDIQNKTKITCIKVPPGGITFNMIC